MTRPFDKSPIFLRALAAMAILCGFLTGCGRPATAEKAVPPANASTPTERQTVAPSKSVNSPAPSSPVAVAHQKPAVPKSKQESVVAKPARDEPIREPATVEQAAAAIDFSKLPLPPGTKAPEARRLATLGFQAPGDIKTVFEFVRKSLLDRGCKEAMDAQIYDQSASGSFSKDGFFVSVSVFAGGEPGQMSVQLFNHGNVNLARLPVPEGLKLSHSFPAVTAYTTEAPKAETAEKVKQLLLAQGWQPYGIAGDEIIFKKNAVQLSARVHTHDAQPGKTFVDFSSELMSADLPAPPDAERVQYADSNKRLDVEAIGTPDDVAAFYRQALAPAGWQPTTDNRIVDRTESFLVFRNPAKDMLTLNMRDLGNQKTRVNLTHQSAAEVEEVDRRVKLAIEEKRRKAEEEKNRPKPKQTITLPADARDVTAEKQEIEFHVATGGAKAAVDALVKQLEANSWKAEQTIGQKEAGAITLKKGEEQITIQYVDPGFVLPAEITVSARGQLELERTGQ